MHRAHARAFWALHSGRLIDFMDALLTKAELRRNMLTRLHALPPEYVAEQSACLRKLLHPILKTESPLNVFLYASLPHEVDLLPLIPLYPQHAFYFPRCLPGRRLSFHRVTDARTQLLPGSMGIPTPPSNLPEQPAQQADLIIVPGLAFTVSGHRLGYGGGFYDRLLTACPTVSSLSLALPQQLLPAIPIDEHDHPVDRVLTWH